MRPAHHIWHESASGRCERLCVMASRDRLSTRSELNAGQNVCCLASSCCATRFYRCRWTSAVKSPSMLYSDQLCVSRDQPGHACAERLALRLAFLARDVGAGLAEHRPAWALAPASVLPPPATPACSSPDLAWACCCSAAADVQLKAPLHLCCGLNAPGRSSLYEMLADSNECRQCNVREQPAPWELLWSWRPPRPVLLPAQLPRQLQPAQCALAQCMPEARSEACATCKSTTSTRQRASAAAYAASLQAGVQEEWDLPGLVRWLQATVAVRLPWRALCPQVRRQHWHAPLPDWCQPAAACKQGQAS